MNRPAHSHDWYVVRHELTTFASHRALSRVAGVGFRQHAEKADGRVVEIRCTICKARRTGVPVGEV